MPKRRLFRRNYGGVLSFGIEFGTFIDERSDLKPVYGTVAFKII